MRDSIVVLHVDDEPDFVDMAATFLEREDDRLVVETATTAAEGLDRLGDDVDCVVSDYDMPDQDGIQFLEAVRARHREVPFILFTGKGGEAVASEAISAGVTDYLQKQPGTGQYPVLANRIVDAVEHHRAETNYREIFESVPDGIVVHDASDGSFVDMNTKYAEMYGYDREEFLDIGFEAIHPDEPPYTQERAAEQVARAIEEGSHSFEWPAVRKSGEQFWTEVHLAPTLLNGQDRVLATVRDVTERKERERELERVKDFFTEAERLGTLGAWEFNDDGDVVWTTGTRRIHGVDDDFEPTMERVLEFIHPDDRETIQTAIEDALEAGEPYEVEVRLQTADGEERWVRARGKPVEGRPDTVRGFIQDITEQRARERELTDAKSQIEAAVEAGAVGTWEWHIPENALLVGPEFSRKFGVDPDAAREGVPLERFTSSIHEADRERVEGLIQAAVESCGGYEAEYRVRDADGDMRWVVARGRVECDESGDPIRFPGALTDVTERKRYEQRLERQNERLEEFASVVSHDLRNPLNVADGRLEMAMAECDSDYLDDVSRAHDRMWSLIEDLLTLAREGDDVEEVERVDIADLVEACWANVETADGDLTVDEAATILADRNRLTQLLENLLRNAVEHGGTDVTVAVGRLEDGFYVEDDGPGIPAEARDQAFSAGFSTREEGTGFGLSIVEQVVESHGWDVRLTESETGGARIEVTEVDVPD